MQNKIMILSIYPAPYRVQLFQRIGQEFDVDIFFEKTEGDARDSQWFCNNDAYLLNTKQGKKKYKTNCRSLKKFDLVILYDYSTLTAFKLILLCKMWRIPYIINCDGVMLTSHGNVLRDTVKSFLVSGARACLASGERAKNYFKKYGAREEDIHIHTFSTLDSSDILSKPLLKQEKQLIRKKLDLPTEKKVILGVGRFITLKQYDLLLRAWAKMSSDYVLLLIGGGEEERTYRNLIKEKNLENVKLERFHIKEELLDYYKAADVFVHPTSYDVWGLVINEAMASGLPVVASDHCVAALELIHQGENGYIVPKDNMDEFLDKVKSICRDEKLHLSMGKLCLEKIRPYTIENMARTHIAVFAEIVQSSEKVIINEDKWD